MQLRGGRSNGAKNWGGKEINYLEFQWGYKCVKEISNHLKRTPMAIIIKAKRVKLGSPYKSGDRLFAQGVSKLLNVDIHTVIDYWISKLGLKAKYKAMRIKRKFYLIELNDLLNWLKENQDKWDSRKMSLNAFGFEPLWLKHKRILDSYKPKRRNQKWNKSEDSYLLLLFYKTGKTIKEISEIMERSFNGVEHRLSRIRPNVKVKIGC